MTLAEVAAKVRANPWKLDPATVEGGRINEVLGWFVTDPEFKEGPNAIAEFKRLRERLQQEIQREEKKCTEHHGGHPAGFLGVCEYRYRVDRLVACWRGSDDAGRGAAYAGPPVRDRHRGTMSDREGQALPAR